MTGRVVVDTGPLVALLNRRDRFHAWAREHLGAVEPPLLTCEPVLTEACFLVRALGIGARAVAGLLDSGAISVPFRLEREVTPVTKLLKKYADVPMSLADACLVRMSELVADRAILTLDAHFRIYRKHGREVIPTFSPRH